MKTLVRIAWRYFRIKQSVQVINIISWISLGAIAASAAAMILLFSIFNGLGDTIKEMYTSFTPELKVIPKQGKFFSFSPDQLQQIGKLKGVQAFAPTIEDMALLNNEDHQKAGMVKGVNEAWFKVSRLENFIYGAHGSRPQSSNNRPSALVGLGIANNLGLNVNNPFAELQIFYPNVAANYVLNPERALSRISVNPNAVLHLQEDIDDHYVLIPLIRAQELFNRRGQYSAIEIKATHPAVIPKLQKHLQKQLGDQFKILNQYEQNDTLFLVLSTEKWMIYLILLFVLFIATFNLTGSLYMLVLEKRKDISILKSMGMSSSKVAQIFLAEGVIITMVGATLGLIIGLLISLGQIYFGWVKMPPGFVIDVYPVAIQFRDIALVLGTTLVLGILAALYPSRRAAKQELRFSNE